MLIRTLHHAHQVSVSSEELIELMQSMSALECTGSSGLIRALHRQIDTLTCHVAVALGPHASSTDSSDSNISATSGWPTLTPTQAHRALSALLVLGVMPTPKVAARLLKAALTPAPASLDDDGGQELTSRSAAAEAARAAAREAEAARLQQHLKAVRACFFFKLIENN
jgi:hypothetical protein